MSESRNGVNADSPSTNISHIHPSSYTDVSGQRDNPLQSGRASAITVLLPPSPATADHRDRPLSSSPAHPPQWLESIGFDGLVITAVAVITIQLNMVTSSSMANTIVSRAFLFFGMMSELLAIILAICFLNTQDWQKLPVTLRLASRLPIMFLLAGIVVLAAALVVEMLKTSLGAAVAMGGSLVFGIIVGLLASFFGA